MAALTKRQYEVLEFIASFIAQKRYSPSLEEIGEHFGLSSVATAQKHVSNLEKKGFIKREWNRSRTIEIVDLGQQAPGINSQAPVDLSDEVAIVGLFAIDELLVHGNIPSARELIVGLILELEKRNTA